MEGEVKGWGSAKNARFLGMHAHTHANAHPLNYEVCTHAQKVRHTCVCIHSHTDTHIYTHINVGANASWALYRQACT
jgi:hypothetical protein